MTDLAKFVDKIVDAILKRLTFKSPAALASGSRRCLDQERGHDSSQCERSGFHHSSSPFGFGVGDLADTPKMGTFLFSPVSPGVSIVSGYSPH